MLFSVFYPFLPRIKAREYSDNFAVCYPAVSAYETDHKLL